MGHRSIATTQGYYSVTAGRVRKAVDSLAAHQFDGRGQHMWSQARVLLESEHQRLVIGQVAVPFGTCTEPSNVQAGGGACPFRFRCLGCGHFRSDPSYLPELRDYLDTLLRDRERIRSAIELDEWARAEATPSRTRSLGCGNSSVGSGTTLTASAATTASKSKKLSELSAAPVKSCTSASRQAPHPRSIRT